MSHKYAGADWLKEGKKIYLSEFGKDVANILGLWERGIYHCSTATLKADWGNPFLIEIKKNSGISAYRIVELLVLCERKKIHVEIKPHTFKYIKLIFRRSDKSEKGISADVIKAKEFAEHEEETTTLFLM